MERVCRTESLLIDPLAFPELTDAILLGLSNVNANDPVFRAIHFPANNEEGEASGSDSDQEVASDEAGGTKGIHEELRSMFSNSFRRHDRVSSCDDRRGFSKARRKRF